MDIRGRTRLQCIRPFAQLIAHLPCLRCGEFEQYVRRTALQLASDAQLLTCLLRVKPLLEALVVLTCYSLSTGTGMKRVEVITSGSLCSKAEIRFAMSCSAALVASSVVRCTAIEASSTAMRVSKAATLAARPSLGVSGSVGVSGSSGCYGSGCVGWPGAAVCPSNFNSISLGSPANKGSLRVKPTR